MTEIKYEIPDCDHGAERSCGDGQGMCVWPVLADGREIGRVVERLDGYQAKVEGGDALWYGPERPFREQAIDDVKAHG